MILFDYSKLRSQVIIEIDGVTEAT